jgi:uncharacterized protein DUF5719
MTRRLPGVLGLAAVLTICTALTAGSTVLPGIQRTSGSHPARLPISRSTPPLVCPGPETLLVPDGGSAVDPGGAVLISALVGSEAGPSSARLRLLGDRSAAAVEAARTLPSGPGVTPVQVTRARSLALTAEAAGPAVGALAGTSLGPAVLTSTAGSAADSTGSRVVPPPSLAAVQSTLARSGDLRALTATTCTGPVSDSWLVGGSTVAGDRLRLLLANPAATPAVVDVDVHGPKGRVRAASGEGVVVPAGAEVPIFVDALAPDLKQVAVHVTTRSGRVRATLHDSRLRGLQPAGADDVPVAAVATKKQIVPGISLVNGYAKTADDPTAPGSTSVRIAVPGAEEAVVRVRLLDSSGPVDLPRAAVVSVPGGGVADVPVSGIPSGTYTAVVESDVPIVAGALVGRGGAPGREPGSEFAWVGSARPLVGSGYVALVPGARSTLSLGAAAGTGRLTVSEVQADGSLAAPVAVEVPAGTSVTLQLSPDAVAVRIDDLSGGPVGASVVSWVSDPRGSLISVLSVDLPIASSPPTSATQDRALGLR